MNKYSLRQEMDEISKMGDLPEHLRTVLVDNRKMNKKIIILESQIQEKNQIIQQLKIQLDHSIVQQTEDRLAIFRNIEDQVDKQVQEVKQKYYEKSMEMQAQIDVLRQTVQEQKEDLSREKEKSCTLSQKIESLKSYIMDIVEQKDQLITELGKIIQEQQGKISQCSFCNKSPEELCQQLNAKKTKRKAPVIRRNE